MVGPQGETDQDPLRHMSFRHGRMHHQFLGGREVDYILLCDVPCDGQRLMAAAGASVSSDVEEF